MTWYLTGLLLVLQIWFWGLGLTLLILPARWRKFWPAFCGPAGLGLQSAVVWAATHTVLPGTDSYAFASLTLPVVVLLAAVWRLGLEKTATLLPQATRWWAVGLIMAGSFALLLYPFTRPPGTLTAVALGSCDAADYAAGARVFKEFASNDRSGFIGLTEVVRILSADTFFDFWLRFNHFTPSALIALNASLFDLQPYQLTSLFAVVLSTLSLPSVFWLVRAGFRFGRVASVALVAIYALSPILFYTVYQDALGQLLAAPAVALLIWVCVKAYQGGQSWRHYASYFGLLLLCNWLMLGSYNFFLIFAYVPPVAYVGARMLWERAWRRGWHWAGFVAANLLVCTLLFPGRVLSVLDRFRLFDETPFGWRIAGFAPSGWYGVFADVVLNPANGAWVQLLTLLCLGTLAWAIFREARRAPRLTALLAACTLPILAGYGRLIWQENQTHHNQSYDAFKLFSVFYPALLAGFCLWLRALRGAAWWAQWWGIGLCAAVLWANGVGAGRFNTAVRRTALVLDPDLIRVATIEKLPAVTSINVCVQQFWPRIWANYFLLRKPQYFTTTTYEGRRATPLRGEWDLRDGVLEVRPTSARDGFELDNGFNLLRREGPEFLDLSFAEGWYAPEYARDRYWCWSGGNSRVLVRNPHAYSLHGTLEVTVRSDTDRHVRLWSGPTRLWQGTVGRPQTTFRLPDLIFTPGANALRFDSPEPADPPGPGETRALAFALCHLQLDLQPAPVP